MKNDFITKTPDNHHLSTLVDYYFYIDIPVNELKLAEEYVIPFPRITFGYFFDHPFLVTNYDLEQSRVVNMVISRISNHNISVQPQTDRVRIAGAHARPHILGHLTDKPVSDMDWLIDTGELFQGRAAIFQKKMESCNTPHQMFEVMEQTFLDSLLVKDLKVISEALTIIEECSGEVSLKEIAGKLNTTDRTLRNQFHRSVGCAPKEYIDLVKLKGAIYKMKFSDSNLTNISHESNYFDQAHFIKTLKRVTGKSPKSLREDMPDFRFLQF